ncbi:IclR family transcriptional regulator [Streptomyces anulatus]|uniref:IclR family transcriptional regulator n=1 Tax=Streptomyces anulatus TaxID=1892 RepID=UPI003669BD6E
MDIPDASSRVGVLDKAAMILGTLTSGPFALAELAAITGFPRAPAYRLTIALERHRLVARDARGRFVLGPRLAELSAAAGEDHLLAAAGPILNSLRDTTGEITQLYRRHGEMRLCIATAERTTGLRDIVPVGSALSMKAGSAAQILLAWEEPERFHQGLQGARFTAATLGGVRRRGWAQSIGEGEPGTASVSAPVRDPSDRVVAAVDAADRLTEVVSRPWTRAVHDQHGVLAEALAGDGRRGLTGQGG